MLQLESFSQSLITKGQGKNNTENLLLLHFHLIYIVLDKVKAGLTGKVSGAIRKSLYTQNFLEKKTSSPYLLM